MTAASSTIPTELSVETPAEETYRAIALSAWTRLREKALALSSGADMTTAACSALIGLGASSLLSLLQYRATDASQRHYADWFAPTMILFVGLGVAAIIWLIVDRKRVRLGLEYEFDFIERQFPSSRKAGGAPTRNALAPTPATPPSTPGPVPQAPLPSTPPVVATSSVPPSPYAVDDRVEHALLGKGTVTAVNGQELTIEFDSGTTLTVIAAAYAALRRVK